MVSAAYVQPIGQSTEGNTKIFVKLVINYGTTIYVDKGIRMTDNKNKHTFAQYIN